MGLHKVKVSAIDFHSVDVYQDHRKKQKNDADISPNIDDRDSFVDKVVQLICYLVMAFTFPVSIWFCFKVVNIFERIVIYRFGRMVKGGPKGPGLLFVMPYIDSWKKIDLRTSILDVPPQEVLTSDSLSVTVDAIIYYRVIDPVLAVSQVKDYSNSVQQLATAILRNVLGTKTLIEILTERETISSAVQSILANLTDKWGVHVERIGISDVGLPESLQRSMAIEAHADREAEAKALEAEGENQASKILVDAATTITSTPAGLALRYLQTMNLIAAEKDSTIYFPMPINFMPLYEHLH